MTIAKAFNEIAVAQGGTASTSGTIAGAIDALNDALAGSDQQSAQTIEGAIRLLGAHIGGGSSVTVESLTATENKTYTAPEGKAYSPVTVSVGTSIGALVPFIVNYSAPEVNAEVSAFSGTIISVAVGDNPVISSSNELSDNLEVNFATGATVTMVAYGSTAAFYECVFNDDGIYTSVTAIDLAATYDADSGTVTFTVPEVSSGKYLVLYTH